MLLPITRRVSITLGLTSLALIAAVSSAVPALQSVNQRLSAIYVASDDPVSIIGLNPSTNMQGSRTELRSPFGLAVDRRHKEIFVANRGAYHGRAPGSIVRLPAVQGDPAPKSVIRCRGADFWGVTLDSAGHVVTGDLRSAQVLTYDRHAQGCPPALSSLSGPSTGITSPIGVAFDSHHRLVVLNFNTGIEVFAPGASGDVAPVEAISGMQTGLRGSEGLALDNADNMYVATYSGKSILEFAAGSNGNVPPMRTIAGPHTLLENPIAVAVDRDGTIYAADYGAHALLVFSAQASGDAPPSNVIHMAQPTAVTISERR